MTYKNDIEHAKDKIIDKATAIGNDVVEDVVEEARKTARRLGKEKDVLMKEIRAQVSKSFESAWTGGQKLAKQNPGKTLLTVFAGGIVLGAFLFSRRGSPAPTAE